MATSLLIGNGINRLSNEEASWEYVLQELAARNPVGAELELIKQKPFPLVYGEILLRNPSGNVPADELRMKRRIAKLVEGLDGNGYHRRVMESGTKHVMTTNYDYGFEKSCDDRGLRKNVKEESKYNLFRRRAVGRSFVWHVHGEAGVSNSITLGYDHYSGYLQKLRDHATADRGPTGGSPFKRGDRSFDTTDGTTYSWLDVFFRDDVHIVGLGLDYTEIDLWWALTYKARLKARRVDVGKTIFHDWHREPLGDHGKGKHSLLRALAVEVVSKQCDGGFESAYDDFISVYLNAPKGEVGDAV